MLKIGFLGPKGTFSQEAVLEYVKNKTEYSMLEYGTISDLLLAVQNNDVDEAVVPIENSLEGAVNVTMDMLAAEVDVRIKAEIIITIRQNLLVKNGTDFSDIRHILSHPQAIGQCRKYLNAKFPGAEIRYAYSTASAAQEVVNSSNDMAAVGSIAAADVYGLKVLARGIQDGDNNLTRFIVVSKQDAGKTGCDKTSIVFSTEDKPGSLYRILDIFSLWDINMTRIESRPAKNQLGKYIFFVDIAGHKDDDDVRDALTMVKRKTSFFKFLGSYPQYETT